MKSSLVRQGHLWLTKHQSIMKSVMYVYFNHKNQIRALAYTQWSLEMIYIMYVEIILQFLQDFNKLLIFVPT